MVIKSNLDVLTIGNKKIGSGYPPYIIAEAGVNHNGYLGLALALVDAAATAGADAVKFQTFKAHDVVTNRSQLATYQEENIGKGKNQLQMLKELELPDEFYQPVIDRCHQVGIEFLSTPYGSRTSVAWLESLGVNAYKVASADLVNYLLLEQVALTNKPLILSSGMATMPEIKDAIRFVRSRGNNNIMMLHCTTNYPCPPEEVNLAAMQTMMKELDVIVGYSDHTQDHQAAIMATALGAQVYECHFTLDKRLPGPDHVASAEPDDLAARVKAIKAVPILMGNAVKGPTRSEESSMIVTMRRSVVAGRNLAKGHILSASDLEAKRPAGGLPPNLFEQLLGKKLKKDKLADELITLKDV